MSTANQQVIQNWDPEAELKCTFAEFQSVLSELADGQTQISEATGAQRSKIKSKIENYGWHKGALAQIRAMEAMSSTARADFIRTFEPMFDLMMTKKWKDEMHDLIPDEDGAVD